MKINYTKKYNATHLGNLTAEGKWNSFNDALGSDVESFIKSNLEDSVVDFEYVGSERMLYGKNAFGNKVCLIEVVNADPKYSVDFAFNNITIDNKLYNEGETAAKINKTDSLKATTTFKYLVTGNIAGSTFNETSAQTITFGWYNDENCLVKDNILPNLNVVINPGEEIIVDISSLFEYAFTGKYLGIEYTAPGKDSVLQRVAFKTSFSLKALTLSYAGEYLFRSSVITGLTLSGLDYGESATDYYYTYYLDNDTPIHKKVTATDNTSITLDVANLTEGVHDLFIRVQDAELDSSATLVSNDILISFIYLKLEDSLLTKALAIVTAIPNTINNCDTSKLFRVVTTDKLQGDVQIVVLKSSNLGDIIGIKNIDEALASKYIFKEITLSLRNTDSNLKIDYNSYIEVNSTSSDYLIVIASNGDSTYKSKFFQRQDVLTVTLVEYKKIEIINPKNGISHLLSTAGSILNFSQINNGNVFQNLSGDLDESDGFLLEEDDKISLSTFKVSPITGVFETPKPLLNSAGVRLSTGPFSIEMVIKTYNCNDLNDEILSIGNIKLCPKHLFVYKNGESVDSVIPTDIRVASRADFSKNKRLHILITFDPNYKPSTYNHIYNELFAEDNINYDNNAEAYPCLKIYVDGVINRTIKINASSLEADGFNLQIHPTNSNINFYVFRTYDKALNYREIRLNYVSSLLHLSEKELFYQYNDILYNEDDFTILDLPSKANILNTISLGKCINKFYSVGNPSKLYINRRVLLLALPEGIKPPYYGNRKDDGSLAAFLVNYPGDKQHSGRLSPEDIAGGDGIVKALGSSAKKYTIHNTSYSKFIFTSEEEWFKEEPVTLKYYTMPGDDTIRIKKLVGKVNYASSMQSHKQGATKLFHKGYLNTCMKENLDTSWMNGGRKAVLEDDFLYFYVNVPVEDLDKITWDYFKDDRGNYNFENCYFLGFQTWGSAKGDKPTSGYDDNTPYYVMLEGADNANPAANFKVPWAAMQCWEDVLYANTNFQLFSGKTNNKPDYLSHLLINDETIVYNPGQEKGNTTDKRADSWDVDFGATEAATYDEESDNLVFEFEEKAKVSLNRFAEFYNLVYKYDFSSLVVLPVGYTLDVTEAEPEINGIKLKTYNKIVFNDGCSVKDGETTTSVNPGDIYRWEKGWPDEALFKNAPKVSKWVPGGLFYNNGKWDSINLYTICNEYTKASSDSFFSLSIYDKYRMKDGSGNAIYYGKTYSHTPYSEDSKSLKNIFKILAEAFKIIVAEYTDMNDVAYHQAFIRLVAGTDNRAKNTYFLIVGPIGKDETYEINAENLRKDFKIHLYQDDLDTIFKTDNNGLQVKSYYLLEPPFNTNLEALWGDLHSGFFYNLDITCIEEIKKKLGILLDYAIGTYWPDNENSNIYKYFLLTLKNLPAIAYNHQSEIYYEAAETLWQDTNPTQFYNSLAASSNSKNWKDFSNNLVANPLSLSHGNCYDTEVEYLRDRLLLLSSYTNTAKYATDTRITLTGGSLVSGEKEYNINTEYTSFILYIYPIINGKQISKDVPHLVYDPLIDLLYTKEPVVYNIAMPGKETILETSFMLSGLTTTPHWESTDLYKTIRINSGTDSFNTFLNFPNASTVICQDSNYLVSLEESEKLLVSDYLQASEHLILQGANIQTENLDFTGCNRLKTLVIGKTTNIQGTEYALQIPDVLNSSKVINLPEGNDCTGFKQLILPNSNTLTKVILPNCIETLNMGLYPKLESFEITEGVKITNLVIDGRNDSKYIDYLIDSCLNVTKETTVYINNIPDKGIWLSEESCLKLAELINVHFDGIINIGNIQEGLTGISFNTKKSLVKRFGDINNIFKYAPVPTVKTPSVSTTATIQSSGYAPINLTIDGNDVPIINGHLDLKYSINPKNSNINEVTIDQYTGYLTIPEGHEGEYIITVVLKYGSNKSITLSTNLTIGFYTPKVGDFAYGNGTFNSEYDSALPLVGIVYYSKLTDTGCDLKVLSSESIIDYLGPCKSLINNNTNTTISNVGKKQENYYDFLVALFGNTNIDAFYTYNDDVTIEGTMTVTHDTPELKDLTNAIELDARQHQYNNFVPLAKKYAEELGYSSWEDKNEFDNVLNAINGLKEFNTGENTGNYDQDGLKSFTLGLFPAILKTLYYEPQVLKDKGLEYFKEGVWHVPTFADLLLLLHYRICSSSINTSNTKLNWNATSRASKPISSDDKFKATAFSKIAYLNQTTNIPVLTTGINGESYYYGIDGTYDAEPKWRLGLGYYYYNIDTINNKGLRDHPLPLFPVCSVTLSK